MYFDKRMNYIKKTNINSTSEPPLPFLVQNNKIPYVFYPFMDRTIIITWFAVKTLS